MRAEDESSGSAVPVLPSGETTTGNQPEGSLVNQVFTLFKDYLENKLESKTKEIEQKSKIDKEVVQLKFKGN